VLHGEVPLSASFISHISHISHITPVTGSEWAGISLKQRPERTSQKRMVSSKLPVACRHVSGTIAFGGEQAASRPCCGSAGNVKATYRTVQDTGEVPAYCHVHNRSQDTNLRCWKGCYKSHTHIDISKSANCTCRTCNALCHRQLLGVAGPAATADH
jgi:hypothetical protein